MPAFYPVHYNTYCKLFEVNELYQIIVRSRLQKLNIVKLSVKRRWFFDKNKLSAYKRYSFSKHGTKT